MNSTLLWRVTGTAAVAGLLVATGALSALAAYFSTTSAPSGCIDAGYGFQAGYGYGYMVTCNTTTPGASGGGGGSYYGGTSTSTTTTTTTNTTLPTTTTTPKTTLDITDPYACGKSINGTVTNGAGKVSIVLKRLNKVAYTFEVTTDANGNYTLPINYTSKTNANYIAPGTYTVYYSTLVNGTYAEKSYRTKITNKCTKTTTTDGFVAPKSFPKTGA